MSTISRPDRLIVVTDPTPGVHRTDSPEIAWWLPLVGPTGTCLAVVLAATARQGDATFDTVELARTVGLAGNQSKLWVSLERLAMFGVVRFASTDVVTIRLALPLLSDRQQRHLPAAMAARYRHDTNGTAPVSRPGVFTGRASASTHSPTNPSRTRDDDRCIGREREVCS